MRAGGGRGQPSTFTRADVDLLHHTGCHFSQDEGEHQAVSEAVRIAMEGINVFGIFRESAPTDTTSLHGIKSMYRKSVRSQVSSNILTVRILRLRGQPGLPLERRQEQNAL